MNAITLRKDFAAARATGLRARDAAAAIGVSEGEAVAAHAGTHDGPLQAVALQGPWMDLLHALSLCGPVLALTRNETTVHEKTGVYENLSASGHMGLALGEAIDLRLFLDRWHAGYAVTEAAANPGNPPSLSLQFFDASGVAVHKIFAREQTDRDAFETVMRHFGEPSLASVFVVPDRKPVPGPDSGIDVKGLSEAWAAMTDTHQFFGLLRKFAVERQQSFRLTEGRFTARASSRAVRELLQEAAFDGTPIMVFVGSPGCIQIHSGPVTRVEPMEIKGVHWLNVLDPGFNLHLREDLIEHVWVVEKPTSDGVVTSIEAFDAEGGLMAMFFGARKPGQPEREGWRRIVRDLSRLDGVAA
ncbi:MAG: hemin-degrading factor [Ramlibacter sp.]|nr:hemin-degrading factor [Ramlibacter sp.]